MRYGGLGICECGCGEHPVAGRFMPGHDAAHYHRILDWLRIHRDEVYLAAVKGVRAEQAQKRRERPA